MSGFVEVPESRVPKATREAVAERLRIVAAELEIRTLDVRWFKWTAHTPERSEIETDFALHVLNEDSSGRTLAGKAVVSMIWLRASLPRSAAVHVAAHEARHVWQQQNLTNKNDPRRFDLVFLESDAEEFADRFLKK